MRTFPARRIALGFGVGALAGWVAGLLRTPEHAPSSSGAAAAVRLPQSDFGQAPAEMGDA